MIKIMTDKKETEILINGRAADVITEFASAEIDFFAMIAGKGIDLEKIKAILAVKKLTVIAALEAKVNEP